MAPRCTLLGEMWLRHPGDLATALAGLVLVLPLPVRASTESSSSQSKEATPSQPQDTRAGESALKYSVAAGLPLLAGAILSAALPSEIYKTPPPCRWCNGASPNSVDRWARNAKWEDPCRAGRLSYWTLGAAGAVALLPMSHESNKKEWLINAGSVVDSVSVAMILTQVAKYTVRRERPSATTCHPERSTESDRNLSFFSGHVAIAFAMVSSAQETARLRGRPRNDWLWVGGVSAVATGYFRVAGDRHHLLDVLAGASVGYFVGKWVPRHLHRSPQAGSASSSPVMARPRPLSSPFLGYVRPVSIADRPVLFQVGKGPGRSVQLGISF